MKIFSLVVSVAFAPAATGKYLHKRAKLFRFGNPKPTMRPPAIETSNSFSTHSEAPCSESQLKGKVLGGKYKIEKMIGAGHFSVVFEASYHGERFAVKCLPDDLNIEDEINLLKNVNHKNVIKMVDAFDSYIVTEMCEMDLKRYMESTKLDLPKTKEIMAQVADAIIYLHHMGIFHRDLKPENILVTSDLIFKIADFGQGTREKFSRLGNSAGFKEYLSPEIFNRKGGYSWAMNDVWAMGVICFQLLTRRLPWDNPNAAGIKLMEMRSRYHFNEIVNNFFQTIFGAVESRPTAEQFKAILIQL